MGILMVSLGLEVFWYLSGFLKVNTFRSFRPHIPVVVLYLLKAPTTSEDAQQGHRVQHKRRYNSHQFWSAQHIIFLTFSYIYDTIIFLSLQTWL